MAGSDFSLLGMLLGFSSASITGDMLCVNISIVDDSEVEETESFSARVVTTGSNANIVLSVNISVTDNDG